MLDVIRENRALSVAKKESGYQYWLYGDGLPRKNRDQEVHSIHETQRRGKTIRETILAVNKMSHNRPISSGCWQAREKIT